MVFSLPSLEKHDTVQYLTNINSVQGCCCFDRLSQKDFSGVSSAYSLLTPDNHARPHQLMYSPHFFKSIFSLRFSTIQLINVLSPTYVLSAFFWTDFFLFLTLPFSDHPPKDFIPPSASFTWPTGPTGANKNIVSGIISQNNNKFLC